MIDVDAETFEQYRQIQPADKARAITDCFVRNAEGDYLIKERPCPFLTEKKLCGLQLEYGENFLSKVCASFPRSLFNFGKFFERSLSISCPVAAEMILFADEPMKFELVELRKVDDKAAITLVKIDQRLVQRIPESQIAMISILQERTLSIDQRLIVLGFFVDRLNEIFFDVTKEDALTKLVAAYESKKFLSEQVPRMLASVHFDAKKFVDRMTKISEAIYEHLLFDAAGKKFLDALNDTLDILPAADKKISAEKIADDYERLADARKNFSARYTTLLENFLVNELFLTCLPWNAKERFAKNFGVFVATYKLFELLAFAAVRKNFCGKDELVRLVVWFIGQAGHNKNFAKRILPFISDDMFSSLEIFLEAT